MALEVLRFLLAYRPEGGIMGKKKIKQMKGEEIIQEVAKLFKEKLTPTFNKLFLIRDLLPENEDEAPKVIQDLNKSLNTTAKH